MTIRPSLSSLRRFRSRSACLGSLGVEPLEERILLSGVADYDGDYTGTFSGEVVAIDIDNNDKEYDYQVPGSLVSDNSISANASDGVVQVSVPGVSGSGTGSVNAQGAITFDVMGTLFATAQSQGVSVTVDYVGTATATASGVTASGTWSFGPVTILYSDGDHYTIHGNGTWTAQSAQYILEEVTESDPQNLLLTVDALTDLSDPIALDIYRGAAPDATDAADLIATAEISDPADLTQGEHQVSVNLGSTVLSINPSKEFVTVVADPDPDGGTSDPDHEVYFQKLVLGVVTNGYEPDGTAPQFLGDLANALTTTAGYNQVIPFDWASVSNIPLPGITVTEGNLLASSITTTADSMVQASGVAPGSVVDLHLIGHSRGVDVVSQALQQLESTIDPALQGSFKQMTLLDPHPANSADNFLSESPILGWAALRLYNTFVQGAQDPPVVIPSNVNQVDVYYQQNDYQLFQNSYVAFPSLFPESVLNLQGDVRDISNESSATYEPVDISSLVLQNGSPIGHSEVPYWYLENAIPLLKDPPSGNPLPADGGSQRSSSSAAPLTSMSTPAIGQPPSASEVDAFLYPRFVTDPNVAQTLANEFATACSDLFQGDYGEALGSLQAFEASLNAAAGNSVSPTSAALLISFISGAVDELTALTTPLVEVTNTTTSENAQTKSGLVITPEPVVAALVTNLQITNISGGTLYLHDGVTPISDGEFISASEGAAGLRFTPAGNSLAAGSFTVQGSTSATADGLGGPAATAAITVTPPHAAATKLVFTTQPPANSRAGSDLGTIVVSVEDRLGNLVTDNHSTVTLAVKTGPGRLANGSTISAQVVDGRAVFSTVLFDKAGDYTLVASDGTLRRGTSRSITIRPAQAAKLVILDQPTNGIVGLRLQPTPTVAVEDRFGNIATNNRSTITLTVNSHPAGGGFSSGSFTHVKAVHGKATFTNLSLNARGSYTIVASDGSLKTVAFRTITIAPVGGFWYQGSVSGY